MPFVLVVLFTIALLLTLTGLLLSPRSHSRGSQSEYVVTQPSSRARQVAASNAIPVRAGRGVVSRASSANVGVVARRAGMRAERYSASVGVVSPGLWERLTDRSGPWKLVIPGLVLVFIVSLFLFNMVLPRPLLWMPALFNQAVTTQPTQPPAHTTPTYTASEHLVRLSQLDPAQYNSTQEFNTWAYSACSTAAMTEVMNAYGHSYRITDILKVESAIGEITPQEGLLEEGGIQKTGTHFGFKTTWGHNLSLSQVIAAANSGTPVIVSFPPSLYPGGHLLVVRGGDSTYVDLADSSLYNRTKLTHADFMKWWGGFSAIMTPA